MIFLSTGGYKDNTVQQTLEMFSKFDIELIELSGGKYDPNQISVIKSKINSGKILQVHNYFPPPKIPFVFNLASQDREVSDRSMSFAENAIRLSLELERPYYSFHGGFLLDPKVDELGKQFTNSKLFERKTSMKLFVERVNQLSEYARKLGVELLIENNVLIKKILERFKKNPLLMTNSEECVYVMENTPSNVNLLIDVAHLKVSSESLFFDKFKFLENCDPWIKAYHLSDNNGIYDSNNQVTNESWFWPYLKKKVNFFTLEVYNVPISELLKQLNLTENFLKKL